MSDLIEREAAIEAVTGWLNIARNSMNQSKYNEGEIAAYETTLSELKKTPSAQPEVTEKDVAEYCRKRCLVVITSELFQRMKQTQPEHTMEEFMYGQDLGSPEDGSL